MRTELSAFLKNPPWIVLGLAAAALVIQAVPSARGLLLYDRDAIAAGEVWRLWTGHLVHFGWPHFVVDTGLLLIVGSIASRDHPVFWRLGLVLMPAFVSVAIYWCDPLMVRYAGLSAVNLGLLLYVAAQGWRQNWTDWFWPAVIAIYIGELVYEYYRGGQGGGAIRFDDPSVRVATSAHVASSVYAIVAFVLGRLRRTPGAESVK